MIDPSIALQAAQRLALLVGSVEAEVIKTITDTIAADQGASMYKTDKLAQLAILRAKLAQQLDQPWRTILTEAQDILTDAANAGQGMARIDLNAHHDTHTLDTIVSSQVARGLEQISRDTLINLSKLPALVLRDVTDAYQKIMAEPVAQVALGAYTRRQATEHALQQFAARGFDSFTDKSGRRWRIDAYAEMATRTGAMHALRYGYEQTLTHLGVDLVQITGHGYTCPKCAPWEGAILSLTGVTPAGEQLLPSSVDPDQMVRVRVDGTLDDAKRAGLFHPNCAHSMTAYFPGTTTSVTRAPGGDQASYEASQHQRALEREIRAEKRKLAASLSPQEATKHRAKIRDYQKQIRELLDEHPKLARLRYREANNGDSIKAGTKKGKADALKTPARKVTSEDDATKAARHLLDAARAAEPAITATMRELAETNGAHLIGLDHRLKTEESLARKLRTAIAEKGITAPEAAKDIRDALRYTMSMSEETYTHTATTTITHLREQGWHVRVKNYWANPDNPYQGINVQLITPAGQPVELQFHTPTSFSVKDGEMHKLYEQHRVSTDANEKDKLNEKMHELAQTIPVPVGAEEIR